MSIRGDAALSPLCTTSKQIYGAWYNLEGDNSEEGFLRAEQVLKVMFSETKKELYDKGIFLDESTIQWIKHKDVTSNFNPLDLEDKGLLDNTLGWKAEGKPFTILEPK